MTTKLTLSYGDAELVVTGEYFTGHEWSLGPPASEFRIERVVKSGVDITEQYQQMRLIPTLEDMAREQIEEN